MAYSKHEWNAGEAITAPKMNTLETAVQDVAALADKLVADTGKTDVNKPSLQAQIDTANSSITTINNSISGLGTMKDDISTAKQNANAAQVWIRDTGTTMNDDINGAGGLKASIADLQTQAADGANAWAQISPVVGYTSQGITTPLTDVLQTIRNSVTDVSQALNKEVGDRTSADTTIQTQIDNAVRTTSYGSTTPTTLQEKIINIQAEIDKKTSNEVFSPVKVTAESLDADIKNATYYHQGQAYNTLTDRLNAEERILTAIKSEVETAHRSATQTYDTLDARLDAIEATTQNDYVKKSQIIDSLDIDTSGNVLDARQGKNLNTHITKIETALDGFIDTKTVQSEIDDTESALIKWVNGKIVDSDTINTVISPGDSTNITSAKVGKELYSEITTARGTEANLDARLDAIESDKAEIKDEVIAARTSSIVRTPGANDGDPDTDTTYDSLDERLEAIESHAAAVRTDINTIAGELAMVDNESIVSTNTRVDTLENDLRTMAAELDMLDGTAIKDTNTRIDSIEDEIDAAHRTGLVDDNNESINDTLDNRFDDIEGRATVLENTLNTAETGIKARITTLETTVNDPQDGLDEVGRIAKANATAITHPAEGNDQGGLTERITALEQNPASTTEIISVAAFDELVANEANSSKDYLVGPDEDNLYKYYRIIETSAGKYEKKLISGGDGSGNTSGMDLTAEAYAALNNHSENTDYYVTRSDSIHHYRWVNITDENSGEKVLTEFEIGQYIDINKLKRYNIDKIYNENEKKYYLKLYQYDYGEIDNNIDTDLNEVFPWAANTSYQVEDKVLYLDGYVYKCITNNSDEEWNALNWTRISNIRTLQMIELPEGGGGSSTSTGVVKRLTRIGDQSSEIITGSKVMLQAFYSYHTTTLNENNEIVPEESSAGTYTLTIGNTVIASGSVPSGAYRATVTTYQENTPGYMQFDVTKNCNIGNNTFNLVVTTNGEQQSKSWTVRVIDLHLESDAPEVLLIPSTESYDFPYTAFGALSKILHVIIDNDVEHKITQTLSATTSGRASYITIPAQSHQAHKIEMYLTATVGGIEQTTTSIIREYIWYDVNNTDEPLILASPTDGQTITAMQYSTIEIPYQVYKKDTNNITVEYYLDNTLLGSVVLEDVNTGKLSYLASIEGAHTLKIMVDQNESKAIVVNLNITELDIDVSPVAGSIIDFDPTMLTNSSTNRLPKWTVGSNTYSLTASENFNWSEDISGGGYKNEADGKAFVIKAGSYIDLNYPMFAGSSNNNILTNGAEMKIIFKVNAVRKADAVWYRNIGTLTNKTVGIQLGAHSGWLKTDKATDKSTDTVGSEYPKWSSESTYSLDSIVLYKDTIYKCIKLCTDYTHIIPGTEDAKDYWELLTGDDIPENTEDIETWTDGTEYEKGGIVNYNSLYYKSKKNIINEITTNPKTASDNWLSMGKIETEVLATNSYLYMPYSEGDKIELDININKYNADTDTNFIMSYEDGVPSKAYAYEYGTAGDGLYHDNTIRIGSDDCDIYIYRLRIYNQALTTANILQNFIADGKNIEDKIARYNRNCIYWDYTQEKYFTSPSATATLDPIKLAEVMPDVKVLMLDTPVFTVGKKNFVQNSSLRCIHAEGGNVYKSRGDIDNWLFTNGFHSGQGTTSDNYGQSARNVDFLFEVDGINYPTKKKNMGSYTPSKDYVSKVYIGKTASEWNEESSSWEPTREATDIETCDNWKGDKCKISLTETSVPNNYFNLKVNVASSENVNNALFQKRYDDFLVYNAPAQTKQIALHREAYSSLGLTPDKIKVKNSMEFVPAVLFVRENESDITKHTEFADTNWHFYALGNIGDSKKTDYTRAYDPEDMNEFTCENSDNNTNNGQFQSGVFMYNGHEAIETPFEAYDKDKTYKDKDIVVNNGVIQIYNGETWNDATLTNWDEDTVPYFAPYTAPNTMQYLFPISTSAWNVKVNGEYVNYKHYTLVNEDFDGDHSFEFRYACCGDYRDGDLINDTNGYSTVPNTDPKTSAKQPFLTKDEVQETLNHDVVLAFYEWLVTATPEQFTTEAEQWFVKSAMEFFYVYTHYYTMMDNRAKNTFWHFAKTGEHIEVSRPVKALLHVYEEKNGDVYTPTQDTTIDPEKTYYTQYAFDLWAYDMDTALGIDNNGALVFPYGKEDGDYRTEGDPSSGYAFNGAGSIFWRRLKHTFSSEFADIMNQAKDCFHSEDLINEFDTYQDCYPEEIWRLDIERKYIRTFTGKSVDNSITVGKQNPRFLTSMMQGRKKYQRRQWIRDQGVYFNSKYRLADITDNSNTIEFNCTTPADIENIALAPSYRLQLTPYQDMYLNVQVGNGNYKDSYITLDGSKNLRAKAGQVYTFDLSGNYQETRIYINGANHLSAIGNLAPMYPYSFDLRALAHIKTLDIGTDINDYTNTKFTELKLPTFMPLLESLNIKNCHSVAGTVTLATANNIRTVEATGTSISGISLPDYTSIETLHIPSTVTALRLYGARFLNDFKVINNAGVNDYSSLYKLHIYDSDHSGEWQGEKEYKVNDCILLDNKYYNCIVAHTSVASSVKNNSDTTEWNTYLTTNWAETNKPILPVDWISIATAILSKQSLQTELSLLKLSNAVITNIQTLEPFKVFKPTLEEKNGILEFSGIINVTGDWSSVEKLQYGKPDGTWPELEFNTRAENEQTKCKVTYYHSGYWRNGTYVEPVAITTKFITQGEVIPDIYEGKSSTELPSRDPTIESVFTFGAYDENSQYMVYTGWTKSANESTATPLGNLDGTGNSAANPLRVSIQDGDALNLYTYYYKEDHRYTVRWKLDNDVIATRANQYYGRGYDLEAPTVAYMRQNGKTLVKDFKFNSNGTVSYKIFDGWNKLPTNISPTEEEAQTGYYDIIAVWKEVTKTLNDSDINGVFYDTSNITAEQLLVLSHMNSVDRTGKALTIVPQKTFTYEMGYDSKVEGTTVFTNRRLIGGSESNNSITPFAARIEDKGFTIAIDYQFGATTNSTYPEVLVGCYARDSATGSNITGFALYRGYEASRGGAGINVCYNISPNNNNSSQRVAVGDTSHRNIIVLRRPKGTNTLHIYSARSADATTSLNTEIQVSTIPLTSSLVFNSDAKICLGALRPDITDNKLYSSSEGNNTRIAQGSVYWLKYWDEDLGAGECKALAAWPHETMTAIITAQNSNATNESDKLGLFLHNLNCSNHMNVWQDRFVTGNYEVSTGWDFVDEEDEEKTSVMRGICIKRIFPGLPTELQTIINAPKIGYYRYNRTQGQDSGSSVVTLGEVYTDQGFVYPPSISSINYSEYARYAAESIIERTGANIESTSDITPYVWTGTAATRITAYEPASYTSDSITWNRITPSSKWLNIRFNEWPLLFTSQLRVFVIKSGSLNRTFYAAINDSSNSSGAAITIQQNDIVIDVTDDNKVQGVYMYINSTNQSSYAIQTKAQVDKFATGTSTGRVGGWISSVPYVTRSVTDQTGTYPNFIYIKIDGTEISPSNNSDTQNVQGLQTIDFSFAI